jgi:hypothetical protein
MNKISKTTTLTTLEPDVSDSKFNYLQHMSYFKPVAIVV